QASSNSPSKLASNKADSHLHPLWEGSLLREDNLKPTPRSQIRHSRPPIQQQPPSRTGIIQFAQQAGLQQSRQPPSLNVGGQLAARSQPKNQPPHHKPGAAGHQSTSSHPAAQASSNSPSKLASNKAGSHL